MASRVEFRCRLVLSRPDSARHAGLGAPGCRMSDRRGGDVGGRSGTTVPDLALACWPGRRAGWRFRPTIKQLSVRTSEFSDPSDRWWGLRTRTSPSAPTGPSLCGIRGSPDLRRRVRSQRAEPSPHEVDSVCGPQVLKTVLGRQIDMDRPLGGSWSRSFDRRPNIPTARLVRLDGQPVVPPDLNRRVEQLGRLT